MSARQERRARQFLRARLEELRSRGRDLRLEGYAYAGAADFILREGQWFEPRPRPPAFERGQPAMCFGNAILLSARSGLRYVEGYALPPDSVELVKGLRVRVDDADQAVHHAWNLDAEGRLIDTTWKEPGQAYVGVVFSVERADKATWDGDASVLDDYNRDWPLFRQRWTGETDFEPTDRLRFLRDATSAGELAREAVAMIGGRLVAKSMTESDYRKEMARLIVRFGVERVIEIGSDLVRLGFVREVNPVDDAETTS